MLIYYLNIWFICDHINRAILVHRKFDIVDHVLQKLEKYASNLEAIVEQRTSELVEEKRKTDLLLHRMLPPYVITSLFINWNLFWALRGNNFNMY